MRSFALAAATLLGLAAGEAAAQGRIQARPNTPPILKLDHTSGPIAYRVTLRPGVPKALESVTVEIALGQNLETPDPTFGRRKPIGGAEVTLVLVGPAAEGKKKPRLFVEARRAVPLGDEGLYGASFTAPENGVYGLYIRGTSPAGPLEHAVDVPYGVWPIPEGLTRPPLPARPPAATAGNLAHGRSLCEQLCKKDLPGALPPGQTPAFLPSAFAAGLNDAGLLEALIGEAERELSTMDRVDLVYYLRSLHLGIDDFFPAVGAYVSNEFGINDHGRARLLEQKVALADGEGRAKVFVAFKGEKTGAPEIIAYADTVGRDRLKKENKLGYVLFLSLPGEKRAMELAVALGVEPTYPIAAMRARGADGSSDAALNKQLQGFAGLGKFNDRKSLAKGPAALRDKLLPIYLQAAELATMYYGEEREYTAFDDAFK